MFRYFIELSPAIVCGHFHIDALEVTTNGFAEVLAYDAHEGSGEEDDDAALVEQLEQPVVDVPLVELQVLGNITDEMSHGLFLHGNFLNREIQTNTITFFFVLINQEIRIS